jgi:hypothetical protein
MNKVRYFTAGRLICDTFTSSKDIIKESDFSLTYLAHTYLDKQYKDIEKVLDCY